MVELTTEDLRAIHTALGHIQHSWAYGEHCTTDQSAEASRLRGIIQAWFSTRDQVVRIVDVEK